jgi:hypothetical protein
LDLVMSTERMFWLRCTCGIEAISAEAAHGHIDLAVWRFYGDYGMGWRERCRRVWAAIRGRDLWHDQVVLRADEAAQLGAWLLAQRGERPL